jgi:hypothetical protein
MALPEIIIGSKLDAKGFKAAESATDKLGKSVMNLAKTLGLAFSAAAIANYGKSAVKASLEAQAQQDRLGRLLKITNGATAEQVDILNQQATSLERIGVVTAGNVTQVQSQLATFDLSISTIKTLTPAILDYVVAEKGATASAEEFKSMTNGLAQALQGNFASLTKTGFVLDDVTKKTIATGTQSERAAALVEVLNSTYKDFNQSVRDTPAGKFQVLANEADNVKVAIGTGILDALAILAKDKSIDGAADSMKNFGDQTAYALVGMASLIDKIKGNKLGGAILGTFGDILSNLQPVAYFIKEGKAVEARKGTPAQSPGERIAIDKAAAAQAAKQKKQDAEARAAAAKLAKTEKDRLDRLKKIAYEKNKALVLDKASAFLTQAQKLFDVEAINLAAAAMNKQTEEDKVRIRLKQEIMALEEAINAGNVEGAAKLAGAISKDAELLGKLRGDMFALGDVPNPFAEWLATLNAIAAALAALALIPLPGTTNTGAGGFNAGSARLGESAGNTAAGLPANSLTNFTGFGDSHLAALAAGQGIPRMATGGLVNSATLAMIGESGPEAVIPLDRMGSMGTTVIVNVSGSVTTERDLVSAITQGIYNNQAAGTPITYTTAF